MQERIDRKASVKRLINSRKVHTQDELLQLLASEGVMLTQATLSRDMKQLGAFKYTDGDGETYYKIAPSHRTHRIGGPLSIECSGQLCVVHCQPGFASAIGSVLDGSEVEGVMGCIAGDDTILVILKENVDTELIKNKINNLI